MSPFAAHLRMALLGWRRPAALAMGLGWVAVVGGIWGRMPEESELSWARAAVDGTFGVSVLSLLVASERRGSGGAYAVPHPAVPLSVLTRLRAELLGLGLGLGVLATLAARVGAEPSSSGQGLLVLLAVTPCWGRRRGEGLWSESVGLLVGFGIALALTELFVGSPVWGGAAAVVVGGVGLVAPVAAARPGWRGWSRSAGLTARAGMAGAARLRRDWLVGLVGVSVLLGLGAGLASLAEVTRTEHAASLVMMLGVGLTLSAGIGFPFAVVLEHLGQPRRNAWMWLPVHPRRVLVGLYVHGALAACGVPMVMAVTHGGVGPDELALAVLWVSWAGAAYALAMSGHVVRAAVLLGGALIAGAAGVVVTRHMPELVPVGALWVCSLLGPLAVATTRISWKGRTA